MAEIAKQMASKANKPASSQPTMDKASATNLPEPSKTEKMLLIAKNYWDYTPQPIIFVAPTMVIAADIRNRFFHLVSDSTSDSVRVRCLSLRESNGLKSFLGKRNAVIFFDHTCLERSDLLEAAGKLVNAIWENCLGEVVTAGDDGWGIGRSAAAFTFKIPSSDLGLISSEAVEGFKRASKGSSVDLPRRPWGVKVVSGGAIAPCPWGEEDARETFISYDALRNPFSGATVNSWKARYLPMNDSSKKAADSVARQVHCQHEHDVWRYALEAAAKEKEHKKPSVDLRPQHEVDKLRTADILQAMTMRNAADKAIPEEWMDELSDLVWRERDRLEANTES
jgi:hypothetical protein